MSNKKFSFSLAENLRDIILGGQDGLVNVLGIVVGVAAAAPETRLILAAGLAATFAESFSMGAVAYTSALAERDYLVRQHLDHAEHDAAQATLSSGSHMMSALVVGLSSLIGSFIPLMPYFFSTPDIATPVSIALSAIALFALGAVKARVTVGDWRRSGVEIMVIGLAAAILGYLVGLFFQV